jgi:oxygen-dependent protoporphyrinogen oxidase
MGLGRVVVVGAGPAGAAAAYRLRRLGHEVLVLERSDRVGGRTWTLRRDGFTIDTGAFYVGHFYERALALIDELGLRPAMSLMEDDSGLHHEGRIHRWKPASPFSVARLPNARPRTKLRATVVMGRYAVRAPDPFDLDALAAADRGETVAAWARRTLGDEGYEQVVRPTFEPYWMYSAEEAVSLMLTAFLRHTPRLRLFGFADGMGSISEALVADVDVRLGTAAASVRADGAGVAVRTEDGQEHRADGVVVACEAPIAAELLDDWSGAAALAAVPYAENVHVACGYQLGDDRLRGFPATIKPAAPGTEPAVALALLSRKGPGLVPPGWEVVDIYFSERASRDLADADAPRAAREAAERLLGTALPEPAFAHVFRRPRAIVKPAPGHYARMRDVVSRTHPRVALAGDYLSAGIVEGAIRSGERAADRLDAALRADRPRATVGAA